MQSSSWKLGLVPAEVPVAHGSRWAHAGLPAVQPRMLSAMGVRLQHLLSAPMVTQSMTQWRLSFCPRGGDRSFMLC